MAGKEQKTLLFRLLLFFFLIIGCFIFAGRQMYWIQITRHEELLQTAQNTYRNTKKEQSNMGEIYDCNGNRLVSNKFVKTIAYDPSVVENPEDKEKIARYFSNLLPGTDYHELLRKMNHTRTPSGKKIQYVVLARDVDFEKAAEIERKINGMRMKGFIFQHVNRRYYPKGRMLANILGISYISDAETTGVSGLEGTFKKELKGKAGKISYYRGADGSIISGTVNEHISGQSGKNVYLTISEPIQAILEEEIDQLYEETGSKAVYAAIADPYTGDILAIAQRPTFDPNDRRTMKDKLASTNLISANPYEPGSVMKPFVVAMALDDGVINRDTIIKTGFDRTWKYAGRNLSDTHIVGNATPLQVIQHSSNIGTAMIAVMLGEKRVHEILSTFGFGKKTGLPITPESSGRLNPVKKWDSLTITRVCIGHAIMVTPLQLLRAYCMLANGGYPVQMRMIDAIEDEKNGKVKQPYNIGEQSIFKNPATHREVIRMLKTVTKPGGTSSQAAVPGFEVAGKTGTANKIENGRYVKGKYFSSFCGFIPADNPKFVIVITCDEPTGKNLYGGSTSGPAFARIAKRTLDYMDVQPDMTLEEWEKMISEAKKQSHKDMMKRENDRRASLGMAPLQ